MSEEFLNAATQGDVAKVKEMLKRDSSLAHVTDGRGVSVILMATYYRKKDVVAALLESGVELDIFEASATGATDRVRTLTKMDTSLVNAYSGDGFMPLGLAIFFGHRDTAEALLDAGANVNAASRETMKVTPLASAVAANQIELARLLIARGANVNAKAASDFTPLHEAAARGDIEFAKLLMDHGADVHAKSADGKTPLSFAEEHNRTEMVEFLRKQ